MSQLYFTTLLWMNESHRMKETVAHDCTINRAFQIWNGFFCTLFHRIAQYLESFVKKGFFVNGDCGKVKQRGSCYELSFVGCVKWEIEGRKLKIKCHTGPVLQSKVDKRHEKLVHFLNRLILALKETVIHEMHQAT